MSLMLLSRFRSNLLRGCRQYSQYAANNQIYIHENPGSQLFNVSLSPSESAIPMGYSKSNTLVTPEGFKSNGQFVELLHKTISEQVFDDFLFIMEAGVNANSFMPIYDFREVPRHGRTPEVDSILGYVQVGADGKMIKPSYEANSMYRLCNGAGLLRLSDHLYEKVREACERK